GVEQLAGLRVRSADEPAQQIGLLAERARVHARADERGRGLDELLVLPAIALRAGTAGAAREERQVGPRLGDAQDALLRALRHGLRERMRAAVSVEEPEVVAARAAARDLERVALEPRARVDRLVVGERGPRGDELLRLLLHARELRALVLRRVPRQHDAPNLLVVVAVADHRDAFAARVLKLRKEVDLLDALAELLLVSRDLVEQLGIGDDDEPPFLRRYADRVDVTEAPVVVELGVVVVQDVEVREALPFRDEPANRVRDLERAVVGSRSRRCLRAALLGARLDDFHRLERSLHRGPVQLLSRLPDGTGACGLPARGARPSTAGPSRRWWAGPRRACGSPTA